MLTIFAVCVISGYVLGRPIARVLVRMVQS